MPEPTPGATAYEAYCRCEYGPYMARADAPLTWGWSLLLDSERAAWEAAAQAVLTQAGLLVLDLDPDEERRDA